MLQTKTPALLILAALLGWTATGAHAADELKSVRYVCPDGERFSVEYTRHHARLRDGRGVFSLSADGVGGEPRYSDGHLILSPRKDGATLQRRGETTSDDCVSEARPS